MLNPTVNLLHIPPELVKSSQYLKDNVHALHTFFELKEPPKMQDRSSKFQVVRYGFGVASSSGLGSIMESSEGLKFCVGVWGYNDSEESSNFVTAIEEEVAAGTLAGSTLFIFTNNSTVDALSKDNSSSRKVFHLVLRSGKCNFSRASKNCQSRHGKADDLSGYGRCITRLPYWGSDSRRKHVGFYPITSICNRTKYSSESLDDFMDGRRRWVSKFKGLTIGSDVSGHDHYDGYYDQHGFWSIRHQRGTEVALEEMRNAIIKYRISTHTFVVLRLLSIEWQKQFNKAVDLVVSIPVGADTTDGQWICKNISW
jgi:hypothetical protein